MITKAKYTTLKNFLVKGANLAPVDFSEIEKFEKANFKNQYFDSRNNLATLD